MATTNSAISFQGMSSGLQTDALVNAIIAQEGKKVEALTARQTRNATKTTALNSMKSGMSSLYISLAALQDKLNSRIVTSTDINNTNVTASASGAASGNYDLNVNQTATKARISPILNNYTGSSSAPAVLTYTGSTANTTTGAVGFNIDASSVPGGAVSGTFTVGGTNYVLTGTTGVLTGAAGTPLEGLSVTVTGAAGGKGTLTLAAEPSNLAVANPADTIFTSTKASFAVKGTDGVTKAFELTNNSLNGLRDAINASGAAVTASIINTGAGANPYQLVISAKETGTGTVAGGVISLAAIANEDVSNPTTTVKASLGITSGTITGTITTPTGLAGGLTSDMSGASAKDAIFTLNGIQLTRKTNTVSDAADGVIFTLKQGGQTGTTTLTVAQDKTTATAGMQDVITKYNALLKIYKDAAASTKDTNGTILQGALSGDDTSRSILSQIRTTLTGASAGLSSSATFQNAAGVGVKTNADGTLTLDTTAFQAAVEKDPAGVMRLFSFTGSSSNGVVAFKGASANSATGSVGFTITNYSGGAFDATFTGTAHGPITVHGTNGSFLGSVGTDLEGMSLAVTGNGTGTLSLSRGAGQAASDLITKFTAYGSGSLANALTSISNQNKTLANQIASGQSALDLRKKQLQAQFAKMEVAIGQLKSAGGSLTTF